MNLSPNQMGILVFKRFLSEKVKMVNEKLKKLAN